MLDDHQPAEIGHARPGIGHHPVRRRQDRRAERHCDLHAVIFLAGRPARTEAGDDAAMDGPSETAGQTAGLGNRLCGGEDAARRRARLCRTIVDRERGFAARHDVVNIEPEGGGAFCHAAPAGGAGDQNSHADAQDIRLGEIVRGDDTGPIDAIGARDRDAGLSHPHEVIAPTGDFEPLACADYERSR